MGSFPTTPFTRCKIPKDNFETSNLLDALRADKVGDEFGIQYTIVGSGDEFERINDIKSTNANFIIPINFSKAFDVSNPLLAQQISLRDMRKWNQEPSNLKVLSENGVNFDCSNL